MTTTRYEEIGASAAAEDRRAGSLPAQWADVDLGAVLAHVGLDDGGAEWHALTAGQIVSRFDVGAEVDSAREAVLRGYRREMESA